MTATPKPQQNPKMNSKLTQQPPIESKTQQLLSKKEDALKGPGEAIQQFQNEVMQDRQHREALNKQERFQPTKIEKKKSLLQRILGNLTKKNKKKKAGGELPPTPAQQPGAPPTRFE